MKILYIIMTLTISTLTHPMFYLRTRGITALRQIRMTRTYTIAPLSQLHLQAELVNMKWQMRSHQAAIQEHQEAIQDLLIQSQEVQQQLLELAHPAPATDNKKALDEHHDTLYHNSRSAEPNGHLKWLYNR